MGTERVAQWLGRLEEYLQALLSNESPLQNRHELAKQAHALISQAALLGFTSLAKRCTELEQACNSGDDLTVPFESARHSAKEASATITRVLAETAS